MAPFCAASCNLAGDTGILELSLRSTIMLVAAQVLLAFPESTVHFRCSASSFFFELLAQVMAATGLTHPACAALLFRLLAKATARDWRRWEIRSLGLR